MNNMPGVSVKVAAHFSQMARRTRFIMYDYGWEGNYEVYGSAEPLDIGANYGVIDIPVDLVAGQRDKLIPFSMVRKHVEMMEGAGCQASYSEFKFAHVDFTFANREELMAYITSRLSLRAPIPGKIIEPLQETVSSRKLTWSLSERSPVNGVVKNGEILEVVAESSPSTSKLKSI